MLPPRIEHRDIPLPLSPLPHCIPSSLTSTSDTAINILLIDNLPQIVFRSPITLKEAGLFPHLGPKISTHAFHFAITPQRTRTRCQGIEEAFDISSIGEYTNQDHPTNKKVDTFSKPASHGSIIGGPSWRRPTSTLNVQAFM